jgi:hypothetical protein
MFPRHTANKSKGGRSKEKARGGDYGLENTKNQENEHSLTPEILNCRADDKTAEEYALEGGATLHLVLALRGGADY